MSETRTASGVGATTPFVSYQAESGTVGGGAGTVTATLPAANQFSTPALEASGHAYVQLTAVGQYVEWTNRTGQNITAINLRSCIPDAPAGGGTTNTIDFYVNGVFRQALYVTSKYSWIYEGTNYQSKADENPADGNPYHFWDDEHAFITGAAIAPGDTFRIQMDSTNTAAFYYVDVIDVENPPPPLPQPANSLSITTYGAISNNPAFDNTTVINSCFSAARSQGKIAWIPPGTFYISPVNHGLSATGITVQGAGPWYSTITRVAPAANNTTIVAGIFSGDHSAVVEHLCLDTTSTMNATTQNDGAFNADGNNWLINDVWIQHVVVAFWCGGNGGIAENCRILSVWADGGNFNNVQDSRGIGMNLTYSNNFVRGSGDDGMAINSVKYNVSGTTTNYYTIMSNICYVNNTAGCVWKGHCLGLYGGLAITVAGNLLVDQARSRGLAVGRFGPNGSGLASATVIGNTIVRCGGNVYSQKQEAFEIGADPPGDPIGNAYCASNTIDQSMYNAVAFNNCSNVVFQRNSIINPALNGITIVSGTQGYGVFNSNTVTGLNPGCVLFTNNSSTAYIPIFPTNASSYASARGVTTEICAEGGLDLTNIQNGSFAAYNNVNLANLNTFVARVASASGGGIQIRLDSPGGTLLGACAIPPTGGWQAWTNEYCLISSASGIHNVYLVFTGGDGSLFNLEFFGLYSVPGNSTPLPPSSLAASPGNSEIFLSWTASATATGYNIKTSTNSGGPYVTIAANFPGVLYTNTSLANGTTCYFVVSASNAIGESANSPPVGVAPDPAYSVRFEGDLIANVRSADLTAGSPVWTNRTSNPQSVGNFITLGGGSLNLSALSWNGQPITALFVNSVANNSVQSALRSPAEINGNNPVSVEAWINAVSVTPKRAIVNYGYQGGSSAPVEDREFCYDTGGSGVVSGDFGGLDTAWVATPNTNVWHYLAYTWDGTNLTAYLDGLQNAHRNAGSICKTVQTFMQIGSGIGGTGVNGGSDVANDYIAAVRVESGVLTPSDVAANYTLGPLGSLIPGPPTGLLAQEGDGQVILTWNPSGNAAGYNVKSSVAPNGPYSVIATNLTTLAFTNTGLANGTRYYFIASALNAAGESANSSAVDAQPVSLTPPQLNSGAGGGQFQFAWPPDHLGWQLQTQTSSPAAGLGTNWVTWVGSKATNQMSVPIDPAGGAVFFRLVYP